MVAAPVSNAARLSTDTEPIFEGQVLVGAKISAHCKSYYYLTYRSYTLDIRMPLSFAPRELAPGELVTVTVDFIVITKYMDTHRFYVRM